MGTNLIVQLIGLLMGQILSKDMQRMAVDKLCDFVEDAVADTANPFDDAAALPICKMLRVAFDVPDDD